VLLSCADRGAAPLAAALRGAPVRVCPHGSSCPQGCSVHVRPALTLCQGSEKPRRQGVARAGLLGFCDPAPGEAKALRVRYLWRHQPLVATVADKARALQPRAPALCSPAATAARQAPRTDEQWPIAVAHAQLLEAGRAPDAAEFLPHTPASRLVPFAAAQHARGCSRRAAPAAAAVRGGRGRTRRNMSASAPLVSERMLVVGQRPAGCVARS